MRGVYVRRPMGTPTAAGHPRGGLRALDAVGQAFLKEEGSRLQTQRAF